MTFPAVLKIPAVTAASAIFASDLTARDQAILLSVSWYAGAHTSIDGMIDVPDLPLRTALGGLRTSAASRETAQFDRLDRSRLTTDERLPDLDVDGVTVPTVVPGMRRMTIRGAHRWMVDLAIPAAFKMREGEPTIDPWRCWPVPAAATRCLSICGQRPGRWATWSLDGSAASARPRPCSASLSTTCGSPWACRRTCGLPTWSEPFSFLQRERSRR